MTKDNWIKALETKQNEEFDKFQYTGVYDDSWQEDFISQVEKDAIEKTKRETQKEIFDALDKLDMPKPLMALVKDSIGVIGPGLKGLSPLLEDKK